MKAKTRLLLLLLFLALLLLYFFHSPQDVSIDPIKGTPGVPPPTADPPPPPSPTLPPPPPSDRRQISFVTLREGLLVQFVYEDRREGNMGGRSIRFLVLAKKQLKLLCTIEDKVIDATWYEMAENHRQQFGTWLVSCEVPEGIVDAETVVLSQKGGDWSKEFTVETVIPPESDISSHKWNYAICMPLIYGDKYSGEAVAEFVEFYRLCGFEHISLYVSSDSLQDSTRRAIRYYEQEGFIDATEYTQPVTQLWYHGQLGMIHDCLVRHSTTSRLVSFQDLDEFLVSKEKGVSLAQQLDAFPEDVVSIRIPTQVMTNGNHSYPITFTNLMTTDQVDDRFTKCVIRPVHIFEQGIHHTSRAIQDNTRLIAADKGKLRVFHYRHDLRSQRTDSAIPDAFPSLPNVFREAMAHIRGETKKESL